jgi:hypothetical protein
MKELLSRPRKIASEFGGERRAHRLAVVGDSPGLEARDLAGLLHVPESAAGFDEQGVESAGASPQSLHLDASAGPGNKGP